MSFTFNLPILLAAFYLVGIVEFARLCHKAPIAAESEMLED